MMTRSMIRFDEVLRAPAVDKRLEVLRSIQHAGSISEAARANGVSYKAAWQAIETLGNLAGAALVEKSVGGSGGGGARLTREGVRVLEAADLLNALRERALEDLERSAGGSDLDVRGLAGIGLKTSMRNQLPCVVREILRSKSSARVVLVLQDGQALCAQITLESLQLLGLRRGDKVLALFKATAVTVAATIVAAGDVNLLRGRVVRRGGGAARREISLQITPGLAVVGFADADAEALAPLKRRAAAMAALDPSAVVIGVVG